MLNLKIATAIFSGSTRRFSVAVGVLCRCCITRVQAHSRGNLLNRSGPRIGPWRIPYLNESLKVGSQESRNWTPDLYAVHMCNSYHLSLSTLVIKVSQIAHFIKCLVTSVTCPPPPSPSLSPSRLLCLRTQQTAGRFVLTADVWRSPFFYFTSVTVFLCWHFRLIWFGRLIIAALWTVHHSVRTASQQTCSFFVSSQIPMILVFVAVVCLF